jgi:hypothetical protein
MLTALVNLKRDKVFLWLLGQLEEEAKQCDITLDRVPSSLFAIAEREQSLGERRGLRRLAQTVEQHVASLRTQLEN